MTQGHPLWSREYCLGCHRTWQEIADLADRHILLHRCLNWRRIVPQWKTSSIRFCHAFLDDTPCCPWAPRIRPTGSNQCHRCDARAYLCISHMPLSLEEHKFGTLKCLICIHEKRPVRLYTLSIFLNHAVQNQSGDVARESLISIYLGDRALEIWG